MDRLQAFLLELGHGFAFVGRQYHFAVDGDDFYIDLLFFNWAPSRCVVVELKVDRFTPDLLGRLGFYVSWVDANLRVPDRHSPTIGILLCAGRNDQVVRYSRYSLAGSTAALAVADYTYDTLPAAARAAVPTDTELTTAARASTRLTTSGPRPLVVSRPRGAGCLALTRSGATTAAAAHSTRHTPDNGWGAPEHAFDDGAAAEPSVRARACGVLLRHWTGGVSPDRPDVSVITTQ